MNAPADKKEIPEAGPATETATPTAQKSFWQRFKDFSREAWNDHEFWFRLIVTKSGAAFIAAVCIKGIAFAMSLPAVIATPAIIACGGVIAVSLVGFCVGGAMAWRKFKDIYSRTISKNPQKTGKPAGKSLSQKLLENPRIKNLLEKPFMQEFLNSRGWKKTRAIIKKQQDIFLAGLAGSGSAFMGTVSALMLIPQVAAVTVFTIGSLLSLTTFAAVGGVLSAAYGLYLSKEKLLQTFQLRKKVKAEKQKAAKEKAAAAPPVEAPSATPALEPVFTEAAAVPAVEKTQPKPETVPAKAAVSPPPVP